MASRVEEVLADIERGGTTCEEEGSKEFVSRGEKASSRRHTGALSCHHNVMISGESYIDPDEHNFYKASDNIGGQRVELLIDRDSGGEKSRDLAAFLEKRNNSSKKPYLKKTSKPPRPPKGPTLSPADLKLVKELSELAARKRERIEHMKAFRKMKESKLPSLSSNLIALAISIFFLVIILQGVLSRDNDDREFPGSPAPAIAGEGLISIHLFSYGPANEIITSISPTSLEQASGTSVQGEEDDNTEHKSLVKTIRKLNLSLSLFGR